ncbi:MAG: histidine phosphatase family protein [Pseudomonadota bacterium]
MDALHPALLPSLALLPTDRPVALFTRHSIREQAQQGIAGYDVPLTPEGVRLAEAWGAAALTRPLHRVWSSPVGRCIDTARAMLNGARSVLDVTPHRQLVEPGCFVHDIRAVGPLFLELGPVEFANRHFREPVAGVRSPGEGTHRLLGFVRDELGQPGSLSLFVTHDTILAACIYTLLDIERIDSVHWPWMMEGAFLWFDGARVQGLWRGERFSRAIDELLS